MCQHLLTLIESIKKYISILMLLLVNLATKLFLKQITSRKEPRFYKCAFSHAKSLSPPRRFHLGKKASSSPCHFSSGAFETQKFFQDLSNAPLLIFILCAIICCCSQQKKIRYGNFEKNLRNVSEILIKSDWERYHAALSKNQKDTNPVEDIRKSMEKFKKEYEELGHLINKPSSINIEAHIHYKGGKTIKMILEEKHWKIKNSQSTFAPNPIAVCRELAKTLQELKYQITKMDSLELNLVEETANSIQTLIEELNNLKTENIYIDMDFAFTVLPSGRRIEFKLTENQWKITKITPSLFR